MSKKKNTFKKILSILACVALLAITVIPINNVYAEDNGNTTNNTDQTQEVENNNEGNTNTENTSNDSSNQLQDASSNENSTEETPIGNQNTDDVPSDNEDRQDNNDLDSAPLANPSKSPTRGGVSISAVFNNGDGQEVDFSPGATQSVALVNGAANNHTVTLVISGMSTAEVTKKDLTVSLDGSLFWVNDGSTDGAVPAALDQSQGTNGVTTSAGTVVTAGSTNIIGRVINQIKTYHVKKDTAGFTLTFSFGASDYVVLENMVDAIKISYSEDGIELASTKLNNTKNTQAQDIDFFGDEVVETILDCPASSVVGTRGYVPAPAVGKINNTYGYVKVNDPVGTKVVKLTLSNPKAILKIRGYDQEEPKGYYELDDSEKEDGVYYLKLTDKSLHVFRYSYDLLYVYFPSSEGFAVNDEVSVLVESNLTAYNPYDSQGTKKTNTSTFKYKVIKDDGKLSLQKDRNKTNTVASTSFFNGKHGYTDLGDFYVNNSSYVDVKQVVEMSFNSDVHGVRGVYVGTEEQESCELTVTYETTLNEKKTVTKTFSIMTPGSDRYIGITGLDLGLAQNEYLTYIKFETEFQAKKTAYLQYYGHVFDENKTAKSNIIIYNIGDSDQGQSVQKGSTTVSFDRKAGLEFINAGSTSNIKMNAGTTALMYQTLIYGAPYTTTIDPVLYFVIEAKNEKGEYLELSHISLNYNHNGSGGTVYSHENVANDADLESYVVPGVGRVYKLDTSKFSQPGYDMTRRGIAGNERLSIGTGYSINLYLKIPPATPSQTFDHAAVIYWEDGLMEGTSTIPAGISNRNTSTQTFAGGPLAGTNKSTYSIVGVSDLEVYTYGKHHSSQDWISWNEGDEPIAVGNKSSFDIKVDVINGSEKAIAGPVYVYVPIPKEGEEWGEMTHETEYDAFEFDVKLNSVTIDGKTIDLDPDSYKIEYASVVPSHHGDDLASEDWTKSIDDPDINCIRISLSNLPANIAGSPDKYSFIFNCKALNPQAEGLINTFRPRYYKAVPGLESWSYGSYISLETALGEVRGKMFLDKNIDGKYDAGDEPIENEGVKLVVHNKNNEEISEVETDANGEYLFVDLKTKDEYVIKVANPDIDKYIFTRLGTPNTKDVFNTDNQFTGHNDDAEGLSTTVYPKMEDPENDYLTPSVYNIGFLDVNTETTITFDANGGKIGDKETVELKGKPIATLTKPSNPKKTGSTFHYWYLADDTQMKEATIPTAFGFDNLTFKAYYEDINYTVEYETNGGTEIEDKKNVKWNDSGLTPTTNPEKEHYTFEGWYIDDEFNTKYDNHKYSDLVGDDAVRSATLYANYTPVEYTITYTELGDGKNNDNNPTKYTIEDDDIEFLDPIKNKTGYLFATWSPNIIESGSSGNKTIVAKWTPITYTIEFVGGEGATGDPFERNATYDLAQEAPDNDVFEKEGYDFIGWEDKNGNVYQPGDELKNLSSTQDATVTLTAKWEEFYYYYSIGANSTWTKGSNASGVFRVHRSRLDKPTINLDNPTADKDILYTFDKFVRIEIDEDVVDPAEYTATEGSVRIAIKPSYLEKLKDGDHYLTTVFSDGRVTTKFTIKPKPVVPTPPKPSPYNLPKTGVDAMPHSLNTSLVSLALLGIVAAVAKKKTK